MPAKPSAGFLVLVCKESGGEVPTGVMYTQAELARTSRVSIHEECPFCGCAHVFSLAEARIVPKTSEPIDADKGSRGTLARRAIASEKIGRRMTVINPAVSCRRRRSRYL